MGNINYGRLILGGIVAGIVGGFFNWFLNGVLMGQRWADAMKSLNRPDAYSGAFLLCLFLAFGVGGILLVWVYAAIRPRFGAGVRTAVYAGLVVWGLTSPLRNAMQVVTGLFGAGLMLYATVADLVGILAASIAGCALYKEAERTPTRQAASAGAR